MSITLNDLIGSKNSYSTISLSFSLNNIQWDGTFQGVQYADINQVSSLGSEYLTFTNLATIWAKVAGVNIVSQENSETDVVIYYAPINESLTSGAEEGLEVSFDPDSNNLIDRSEIVLNSNLTIGSDEWYHTALHEFGHSLGLDEIGTNANYDQRMSVMSYNQGSDNRLAVSLMALDAEAVITMFGGGLVNLGTNVYDQSNNFSGSNRMQTIVDDGGTDTFNLSSFNQGVTIDLRESLELNNGTYSFNDHKTIVGDEWIYIARGTVIENAIGGGGDDVIIGNAAANRLEGGAGFDIYQLGSAAGKDRIIDSDGAGRILIDGAILQGTASAVEGNSNRWTLDGHTLELSGTTLVINPDSAHRITIEAFDRNATTLGMSRNAANDNASMVCMARVG